jgi:hypothetical protein
MSTDRIVKWLDSCELGLWRAYVIHKTQPAGSRMLCVTMISRQRLAAHAKQLLLLLIVEGSRVAAASVHCTNE